MKIQPVLQRFLPLLVVAPAAFAAESTDWWSEVERSIAASEYEVSPSDPWHAANRAHELRTLFGEEGIRVVPRTEVESSWEWRLSWVAYGRGSSTWPVAAPILEAKGARIDYRRGALLEWYENSPRGLKQGFVLAAPPEELNEAPPDRSGSPIFLVLALSGTLRPAFSEDGLAIDFETSGGARVLRYAELLVTDARGERLEAWMAGTTGASGRGIRIAVDDSSAVYPIVVDPLATSPAWAAEGDQLGAHFGHSVATAGDVNGDGYSDVIVGAPNYDNGQYDEGRAFVYLGSPSGPAPAPAWTAESDQAYASFGASVATAGDVNGDGYADVVVGGYGFDNGAADTGIVRVYHGSATGPSATPSWTLPGAQASAFLGIAVATAGDVNGDGYSDVIVGASHADNGQADEGVAYVFHGSATGLGPAAAWSAEGNQDSASFGYSVATAGDVNGDGYADVVVGAYMLDGPDYDEGRAYLYLGSASGLAPTPAWTADGNQTQAWFGSSVATAGDVNGDGYTDVVVGAYGFDNGQADEGRAYLYLGSAAGLGTTAAWTAESDQATAYLGAAVGTAGDVNGDGYADVVVGAPNLDDGQTNEGRAYVYFGSSSGLAATPTWTMESEQAYSYFGNSVATAGDVNGDGYSDVVASAYQFSNGQNYEGRAWVYLGSAGAPSTSIGWQPTEWAYTASAAGDVNGDGHADVLHCDGQEIRLHYGSAAGPSQVASWTSSVIAGPTPYCSVAAAGDMNNDGYDDFVVGKESAELGGVIYGAAWLFLGSGGGSEPVLASVRYGEHAGSRYGSSVAAAGDVDGDGFGDVLVSASGYGNGQTEEGKAYLYRGSEYPTLALSAWSWESNTSWARLNAVATAGDVNGDGYSDVIAGLPDYYGGGLAVLFHGSAAGLQSEPAWAKDAMDDDAEFGWSVGSAGDVNGDGFADVMVGVRRGENQADQTDEGLLHVFYGSSSGLPWDPGWTAEGNQAYAALGSSAACAGDVNGDGFSDLIVGVPDWDGAWADVGRVLVFLGSSSGLADANWSIEGEDQGRHLGRPVAGAGDVNGDGYADVLVENRLYYGNGGRGTSVRPRQLRSDGSPLAHLGESDRPDEFALGLDARTPFGRGKARLSWEVERLGVPFDGLGLGDNGVWLDTGVAGFPIEGNQTALTAGGVYRWRARLLYHPATTPFQPHGRWLTVPWNGGQEADVRTDWKTDLSVSQTDFPDPQFEGQQVGYHVVVSNDGPAAASAILTDTLPPGSTYLDASASQGSCSHALGTVTCDLGEIPSGGSADVIVHVSAPAGWGTATNFVSVSIARPAEDTDHSNDTSFESTQIRALNIGDHVWRDLDRDGVQDEGEPGLPGVVVLLYNGAGQLLDAAATNQNGYYVFFEGLHYGTLYNLRFVLPVGYDFSPRDLGSDDSLDSDADPVSGETVVFSLTEFTDATGWDAGMHDCWAPDEAVWLYEVGVTDDGNDYPILNFQDPNQPDQVTGYNVYRSDDAGLPPAEWPLVASDVVDMDEGTPNKQWVDTSGDVSPSGIWYYQVTATNHRCPAEGPR